MRCLAARRSSQQHCEKKRGFHGDNLGFKPNYANTKQPNE